MLATLCSLFLAMGTQSAYAVCTLYANPDLSPVVELQPHSDDNLGLRTVVIDAGHGGKDPGCVSADRKTYEKTLTLEISNKLADKIKEGYPEVKVILTRSRDEYVTLNARADKANKANADLFISIHINATTRTSPNGYSVHVLGQSSSSKDLLAYNMDVCRRENSVILLEEDYSTKYQGFNPTDPESYIFMALMQNSYLEQSLRFAQIIENSLKGGAIKEDRGLWQNGFYVLWKTAMPSVLVELGFISNPTDLAALRSKSNRDDIVERLYDAFCTYKQSYDASITEPIKESIVAETSETVAGDVVYGVQIFAISRLIPEFSKEFLSYKPRVIKSGSLYKYFIAISNELEKTKSEWIKIKATYPSSYLVKIEGENVTVVH